MTNAVIKMVNQEGAQSLWKGLLPTLVMSAPYSGLVFYFYSAYQALMTKWVVKGRTLLCASKGILSNVFLYILINVLAVCYKKVPIFLYKLLHSSINHKRKSPILVFSRAVPVQLV